MLLPVSPVRSLPVPDVFVRGRAAVGEGPVVDGRTGELAWVDIPAGVLHRVPLSGSGHRTARVGMSLGAVAVRDRGGYVAAVGDGLGLIDETGTFTLAEPLLPDPQRRMNDAKCDTAGRFFAGSTTLDFRPGRGVLHCWEPDAGVRNVLHGLTLPNGLGWSPDDTTFYLVDTMEHVLLAAPYDKATGTLGELRPLVSFGSEEGMPDGLCIDADGHVWLAMWGAGQVRRYDPRGRAVAVVPMPVSKPSSCAFGPDGVLYITSAAEETSPDREPLAGSVFALPTSHHGAAVGSFRG
jgi:sugar lactone lactonase YvrE